MNSYDYKWKRLTWLGVNQGPTIEIFMYTLCSKSCESETRDQCLGRHVLKSLKKSTTWYSNYFYHISSLKEVKSLLTFWLLTMRSNGLCCPLFFIFHIANNIFMTKLWVNTIGKLSYIQNIIRNSFSIILFYFTWLAIEIAYQF